MIGILKSALDLLEEEARRAMPAEACGMLVGRGGDTPRIVRAVPSRNLAASERHDRFEIDPRLQLSLQRELRGSGDSIIGIYHSHPGGQAAPSETDRSRAVYPGWIWLITALQGDRCTTRAFLHGSADRFEAKALFILDDPED